MEKTLVEVRALKRRYRDVSVTDKGKVFNTDLVAALELGSILDLAEVIVMGALARTESRGSHFRRDFPNKDNDRWIRHTLAFHTTDVPRLDYKPVTITRFPPQ